MSAWLVVSGHAPDGKRKRLRLVACCLVHRGRLVMYRGEVARIERRCLLCDVAVELREVA